MAYRNTTLGHSQPRDADSRRSLTSIATRQGVRRQRRVWSRRVSSWDQHGSARLGAVTAAVLAAAGVRPGDQVVDLGCGQGQVSLPLARRGAEVLAVDVSPAMVAQLTMQAHRDGVHGLAAAAIPIEELVLPAASVDLVVSSYALHHLRDVDKARLVADVFFWLRPGGRVVLADMMFGRGGSSRDREIIRRKVMLLARMGPGGWWRIGKNAARYLLRVQECPVSMAAWTTMLTQAGFAEVTASTIVAEAALITGVRPAGRDDQPAPAGLAPRCGSAQTCQRAHRSE